MLLRSSSTPVLGSLLPSFSESPSNISNHHREAKPNTILHHSHTKLSIHQSGHLNHTTFSTNSSPISPSIEGFGRAQSDGNLAGLAYDASSCNNPGDRFLRDDLHLPNNDNLFTRRPKCLMLETIPSFSMHSSRGGVAEEEESDMEDHETREGLLDENGVVLGLEERAKNMSVTQDVRLNDEIWKVGFGLENEMAAQGLCLEKGLGIGDGGGVRGGGGGGRESNSFGGGGDGEDKQGIEEYYRRMVEENPGNSLFLGNYAKFLYQSKGDLEGAEEYYSRAILADPNDGGFLSQYAKLVWELQRDRDRATSYFERAVQVSPQDSHVQAAYAHFLWETEDDEGDVTGKVEEFHALPVNICKGTITMAVEGDLKDGGSSHKIVQNV